MEISLLESKEALLIDRQGATLLLAEFISYHSALENRESNFSFEDESFRKFVGVAKTLADKWGVAFDPTLYAASLIIQEGNQPVWSSSTGSCGWVNQGEIEDY